MELSINQNGINHISSDHLTAGAFRSASKTKILVLFGTRPEAIKLAPVIYELKKQKFPTIVVSSSQHTDLLAPFLRIFNLDIDYDLNVMRENQTPTEVAARVLSAFDNILEIEKPEMVFVQGDTTTALSGALAAFNRKIKIGHVEAGLRSGDLHSPFPEEMNRRLISQVATFHFAVTARNVENLLAENISSKQIYQTGNTVVDALHFILKKLKPSRKIKDLIAETKNSKRILLTTHRRESFGEKMSGNLRVLSEFVEKQSDVCLIFPVHPNPNVRKVTNKFLAGSERVFLLEPLDYTDFVFLMKNSWLIISDSGGVQEESPSLGKPLLILRENTERPEAIEAGTAKLVGSSAKNLAKMLKDNYNNQSWLKAVRKIENPFGNGTGAKQIVAILEKELLAKAPRAR